MSNKLYILTSDLYRGGVAYSAAKLATLMSEHKRVTLISYENLPIHQDIPSRVKVLTLNCPYSRTSHASKIKQFAVRFLRYPFILVGTFRLYANVKKEKNSVIFAMTIGPALVASLLKRFVKPDITLIVSERQDPSTQFKKHSIMFKVNKFTYDSSDKIHVNSIGLKKVIVNDYSAPESKVFLIENAIDKSNERDVNKTVSKNFKLTQEKYIRAIFLGRLTEQKNPFLLVYITKFFLSNNYDFFLDIFGSGELEYELKNLFTKYNLSDYVSFKGEVKGASTYLPNYNLGIFTSKYESFGNSLSEMISSGLVVIASETKCGLINYLDKSVLKIPCADFESITYEDFSSTLENSISSFLEQDVNHIINEYSQILDVFSEEKHSSRFIKEFKC